MKNNNENVLDQFLFGKVTNKKKATNKKVVINQREGLIERIDRTLITDDGRVLLREQY